MENKELDIHDLLDRVKLYYENKEYQKALDTVEEALKKQPKNIMALGSKAAFLGILGRHEESLETCNEVLRIKENDLNDLDVLDALNNKAIALANLGRSEEAIEYFTKVLNKKPKNTNILNNKSLDLVKLNKNKEAREICKNTLNVLDEKNDNVSAVTSANLEQYKEAIKVCDEVLERKPKMIPALLNKIKCLLHLNQHKNDPLLIKQIKAYNRKNEMCKKRCDNTESET